MILSPISQTAYDYSVLYDLLEQRTPEQSISHKAMPTWDDHCAFVRSQPYAAWYLIAVGNATVGAIYLTHQCEIGIAIFHLHKRKGYASAAVKELMRLHPGKFIANINPRNEASIRFFEGMGFAHIQNTYER